MKGIFKKFAWPCGLCGQTENIFLYNTPKIVGKFAFFSP